MTSFQISWAGTKFQDKCPYWRHREGTNRGQNPVKTKAHIQVMQTPTMDLCSHLKLAVPARGYPPLERLKGSTNTSISGLQARAVRKGMFWCFILPNLQNFIMASIGLKYARCSSILTTVKNYYRPSIFIGVGFICHHSTDWKNEIPGDSCSASSLLTRWHLAAVSLKSMNAVSPYSGRTTRKAKCPCWFPLMFLSGR